MIAKNKFYIFFILLLVTLAFVAWKTSQLPLLDRNTKDFTIAMLNGFWTAFFALLFLVLSSIANKIGKREIKHFNSLINLETQLNEMIGIIKDNLFVLDGFKRTIIKGNVHWGNLNQIFIDKSHFQNLYDIDLINEVFEFFYDTRKLNDDILGLQTGYNDLKNAFIQKQIPLEHYIINAKLISDKVEDLELFYEKLLEKLIKLLARVRLQAKKDKPLTSTILEKLITVSGPNLKSKELESEIKKIEKEMDDVSMRSKNEIGKVIKMKNK